MFTNKKVLVAGGSKGIGAGVVDAFVDQGAKVWYISRTKGNNNRAIHIFADILDPHSINEALDEFDKENLHLDILVNAGAVNYCKNYDN